MKKWIMVLFLSMVILAAFVAGIAVPYDLEASRASLLQLAQKIAGSSARERTLVLGTSKIVIPAGALVGTQVDRVIRDIAWSGSRWDERTPANRTPFKAEDLVPYMEGARIAELMRYAKVRVLPLTPALVKRSHQGDVWYAPDAEGNYRFAIDPSKLNYRTVRRLDAFTAEMPDTHGFNAVAAQAVRLKPFLVVACMDLPSKADAALYLAEKGIHAYGPPDRFGYQLLGYRRKNPRAAVIIGSAPIRHGQGGTAVIGDQPVEIRVSETIIVQFTDRGYPWQYADTPARYFAALVERYALPLRLVNVQADAGQLEQVIVVARFYKAQVVAVRVGKSVSEEEAVRDARVISGWLRENPRHRAILFHTAPYEPGYKLFFEFPKQVTFGDYDPLVR